MIGTNLLANNHDDRTIKVLTRPYGLLPGDHVFQPTFHEDRTLNVASRLLTSYIIKNAPPPNGHVLQPTFKIFGLVQNNIWTHLFVFMIDRHYMKNAPPSGGHSRVLTRFYYSHIWPYY
ncbi:hypothetical protein DPMN_021781 [Dreissena polymorpha]|uniref:Uncharacterized protein n=1 Tax=Dreissena polymorpha TaxID=45954 RepID=A0A9D4NMR3_DREPO|nr:hypothetical protein DPMN_021781 [Dreissena polymorpha]